MSRTGHKPLAEQHLKILRGLRELGGWCTPVELAVELCLPGYAVREGLHALRVRRMCARGGEGHWGEFTITQHGRDHLDLVGQSDQLTLR